LKILLLLKSAQGHGMVAKPATGLSEQQRTREAAEGTEPWNARPDAKQPDAPERKKEFIDV